MRKHCVTKLRRGDLARSVPSPESPVISYTFPDILIPVDARPSLLSVVLRTSSPSSNSTPDQHKDQRKAHLLSPPCDYLDSILPVVAGVLAGSTCPAAGPADHIDLVVGHTDLADPAGMGLANHHSSLHCLVVAHRCCSMAACRLAEGTSQRPDGLVRDIEAGRLGRRIFEPW